VDLEKLKHLTDDQKGRFVQLERLFTSDGWSLVEEWAAEQHGSALARVVSATTWEANRQAFGAAQAFAAVRSLREASEAEFEAMADANAQSVVEEDEARYE
jgi:hypothetical protein